MPLSVLPFPAELAGLFTRESLTGEKDTQGPYKDQSERAWQELILRFWKRQADQIVGYLQDAGISPPPPRPAGAVLVAGATLFTKAYTPVTEVQKALKETIGKLTPYQIGKLTEQGKKDWAKKLLRVGAKHGMTGSYTPEQIDALSNEDVSKLLAGTVTWYGKGKYATEKQITQATALPAGGAPKPKAAPAIVEAALGPPADSQKEMLMEIGPQVQKDAQTAAAVTSAEFQKIGVTLDWTLINADASAWARKYAGELVKNIDATTRKSVGEAIGAWIETPGLTYQDLRKSLTDLSYPARRADLIARTEVTRAYAQGSLITAQNGAKWKTFPDFRPLFRYFKVWQTKHDHVVCTACEEVHLAEVEGVNTDFMTAAGPTGAPPLHPGCRCWVTFRPEAITKEEAKEMYKEAKEAKKLEKAAKKKAEQEKAVKEKAAKEKAAKEAAEAKKLAEEQAKADWRPGKPFIKAEASKPDLLPGEHTVKFQNTPAYSQAYEGAVLNDLMMSEIVDVPDDFWENIPDRPLKEPATPAGKKISSGVVMVERDGRIWFVEPKGHYGGYEYTYPKGSMKAGLTAQQNAIKETFEETGLLPEIDGWLGDYVSEKTGNVTRYYYGRRAGGAPWAFQKESEMVYLADLQRAGNMLHSARDLDVLEKLRVTLGVKIPEEVIEAVVTPTLVRAVEVPAREMPEALAEALFPEGIEGLENVQALGGTTGAQLVKDPQTGRLYVLKRGNSAGHIRSEALADELYRRMGVKVPSYRLYETATGPVKLAEYIPDTKSLKDVLASASAAEKSKILAQLQEGFVTDAYLGNWDVIGADSDNILIDSKGIVWRIDNGGALFYRAQGALKADGALNQWFTELWTMRDPSREQVFRAFGGTDWKAITKQLEALGGLPEAELLAGVPDDLLPILQQRLRTARDLWQTSAALLDDKWISSYVDDFCQSSVKLRQAGLLSKLPKQLSWRQSYEGDSVVDEKGKLWDKLRGTDSVSRWIQQYINDNGGDFELIRQWASSQGSDSWRGTPQSLKRWIAEMRGGNFDDYYWREGLDKALGHYLKKRDLFGAEKFDKTLRMWHSFQYEFVRNTPFPNNDIEGGYLKLMRTEPASSVGRYKLKKGRYSVFKRGANESSSLYTTTTVSGHELTLQVVPHHRVFGTYFFERPGEGRMFYGDAENEVLFIPEGLPVYYHGPCSSGIQSGQFWTDTILEGLLKRLFK